MGQPRIINNRYELGDVLGQGGMGVVYRALDRFVRREVAVKTVHDIRDPTTIELFYKEWGVLASLVHPNVVEIYDVGEFEDEGGRKPFFVMPLLPGKTLTALFREAGQPLSVERTVDIVCNTCRGLQAAHDKGLIHRDIKPSNIFVMHDDSVKVIDFGVAHLVDTHSTTLAKGTPSYMAPEQIRMERPSRETDIFSLGVVCYEVLAGRRPFLGSTDSDLLDAILNQHPDPLSEINPGVNQALSRVVHKAIAKQRTHRFPTAREFADALQRALFNQPLDFLDPAHYQPRIARASKAFEHGEYEVASEILGELESEGHVDPQMRMLRDRLNRAVNRKERGELFEKARLYMREEEYGLALRKIQDALQFNPDDTEALKLKAEIEQRRDEIKTGRFVQQARRHLADREFKQARQIIQKALAINPADETALGLTAEIDREERQLIQSRDEKARLRATAMEAWRRGDLASAARELDRLLALEASQPGSDPGTAAADRKFHQQIRRELEEIETALDQAQAHLEADKFDEALALCQRHLRKYPDQPRLLALRSRIEEQRRDRRTDLIQEVRRQALAEPDLEARVTLLEQAQQQFPGEQTLVRLSDNERERRGRVQALIAQARQHEQRGELEQAIEQWEAVRSSHPQQPGLNRQIESLAERRAELLRAKHKGEWVQQIQQQLDAKDYRAAVEISRRAVEKFPGDPDLQDLASQARQRRQRSEVMEQLLADGRNLLAAGRLHDGAAKLGLAQELARQGFGPARAAVEALLETARQGLLQDNCAWAADAVREALVLAPGEPEALELQAKVSGKQLEDDVRARAARARDLLDAKDFDGALNEAGEGLERSPGDGGLQEIARQARAALERIEQRERLLNDGRGLLREGLWERGAEALAAACDIDAADHTTRVAVASELLEQARLVVETDWQGASTLLNAALRLDPNVPGAGELRTRIAQHERAAKVAQSVEQVRGLEKAGRTQDALDAAENTLNTFPGEKPLLKLRESLRKRLSEAQRRAGDIEELNSLVARARHVASESEADELAARVRSIAGRWPQDGDLQKNTVEALRSLDLAIAELRKEKQREQDLKELTALLPRTRNVASEAAADGLALAVREIARRQPGHEQIQALAAEAEQNLAAAVRNLHEEQERQRNVQELRQLVARARQVAGQAAADQLASQVRGIADRYPEQQEIQALAAEARRNLAEAVEGLRKKQERQQDLSELTRLLPRSRKVASESDAGELATKVQKIAQQHPDDEQVRAMAEQAQENLATAILNLKAKQAPAAPAQPPSQPAPEPAPPVAPARPAAEVREEQRVAPSPFAAGPVEPPQPAAAELVPEPSQAERQAAVQPPTPAAPVSSPRPKKVEAVSKEPIPARRRWFGAAAALVAALGVALGVTVWLALNQAPEPQPEIAVISESEPPEVSSPGQDLAAAEQQAFESAQQADTFEAYQQYLRQFPDGSHRADTLEAIQRLQQQAAEAEPSPAPAASPESAPQAARARLSVLTIPPESEVTIVSGGDTIRRRSNANGLLDLEVPAGDYNVEVRADQHEPFRSSGALRPGGGTSVIADLKPLPGGIVLTGSFDALPTILLDGRPVDSQAVSFTNNRIEISQVAAGNRMIRLEQPGFERWDSEVLVQPGGTVPLRAALNRIAPKLASLTIQTAPGAAVSVGGVSKGVVSAQGNLTISDLSPGRHELSITKDRHRPGTRLVDLSGGDNRTERIDLEREFAGPYSDGFFDLNQWQAPASWRIDARKLLVSGPAMGWLGSREYQNFKLDFQLQLANGRGAAWAIRAETPGDFYLFQLRGPSASQAPNTIVVHLYRQGRSAASTPPQPVPIDLGVKDDWLHITAVADGPMITHYVESGLRPAREPLVLHKLASNMLPRSYAFGGIGFGTLDSEEFRISDFIVHPQ